MNPHNQNILLVSRDKELYKLIASFYSGVYYCSSANEAISAFKSVDPLCVFCDETISDPFWEINDGVDLFEKIVQNNREVTKILIQDSDDFASLERAINKGNVFAVIHRPFCEESVKMLVHNGIDYANLLRENSILLDRQEIRQRELLRLKSFLEQKSQTGIKSMQESFAREKYIKREIECMNRLLLIFPRAQSLKELEDLSGMKSIYLYP